MPPGQRHARNLSEHLPKNDSKQRMVYEGRVIQSKGCIRAWDSVCEKERSPTSFELGQIKKNKKKVGMGGDRKREKREKGRQKKCSRVMFVSTAVIYRDDCNSTCKAKQSAAIVAQTATSYSPSPAE